MLTVYDELGCMDVVVVLQVLNESACCLKTMHDKHVCISCVTFDVFSASFMGICPLLCCVLVL